MGYIRNRTRPQGDRPIYHEQRNFGDGLTVDIPKSDLNNNGNPDLENYIAFERYLEGRSGSLEILRRPIIPTGTLHSIKEHPKSNIVIAHHGDKLFNVNLITSEVLSYSSLSFGVDEPSQIREFGDDFLIFTGLGIFRIVTEASPIRFFQINGPSPLDVPKAFPTPAQAPFKYKFVYTFSTLIDAAGDLSEEVSNRFFAGFTLIHETAPVLPLNSPVDLSYFRLFETTTAISSAVAVAVFLGTLDTVSVPEYITHFSVYRTPDLGQNGFNNLDFEQFAWVGDQIINKADLAGTFFLDDTDDEILKARLISGPRLLTVGLEPMPSGDIGEVTEGFVFSAIRNEKTVNYSQRIPDDTSVGFHNPGVQFFKVDDGVQVLAKTPDILSILCSRKSYISSLTAFVNAGVFESVITLIHITVVDDTIGVSDPDTFVKVEQGLYISVCSDKSVRLWDGGGWGRDFAENRVRTIIQSIKTGISIAAYFRGAYLLWFTRDDTATAPDECLRFSVKRESGKGWTFYTGVNLVIPPAGAGPFVTSDFLANTDNGFNFLYVFDKDLNIYWIETFNCSTGLNVGEEISPAKKYFADKVSSNFVNGTDILPSVETRSVTGARESFNLILSEAHAYLRDLLGTNEPIIYPALEVDALAFKDDGTSAVESVGKVKSDGDIQWWYRVEGSRISIKFRTTRSGHQLIGTDTRFRVQDILRPNRGPANTVASVTNQQDFQKGIIEWHFTRPREFLDRIRQTVTPSGKIVTTLAPDNRSTAIQVGTDLESFNRFRFKNSKIVTDDFTISFYIKDSDLGAGGNFKILTFEDAAGAANLTLSLISSAEITIEEGSGSVVLDNLVDDGPLGNGFHQIVLVRSSSSTDVRVYQNNLLKGSVTFGDTFGGGEFELGRPTP